MNSKTALPTSKKQPATEEVQILQGAWGKLSSRPTLLCLSGVQAGLLLPIDIISLPFIIGRDEEQCKLFIDSPEISRQHAHIEQRSDQQLYIVDRNSTNGVFVNNDRVESYALQPNDKIRFGPHSIWKFFYQDAEEFQYYQQMYSNASEDYLTGALNRRNFDRIVAREIAFALRHQRRITIALCDIDHFKRINDTYGHAAGDQILKEFVQRIKGQLRQEDLLSRYGGEEFSLMLREITSKQSIVLLERLRLTIANKPFQTEEGPVSVTVSIGTITYHPKDLEKQTPHTMLQHADKMLYTSKEEGRNRVTYTTSS